MHYYIKIVTQMECMYCETLTQNVQTCSPVKVHANTINADCLVSSNIVISLFLSCR